MLHNAIKWKVATPDSDPGRIRLKQAVRTTFSALLTVCTLSLLGRSWALLSGMIPILMGALSATLASQILSGETRRQKQASTVLAGVSGVAMVLLTWTVRDTPVLNAVAISLMAFVVFYTRRFGTIYAGLGLYALFVYMFGTIVAKTEVSPWPAATAISLSIPLTYLISFYFLAENPRLFLRDNIFLFLEQAGRIAAILRGTFSGDATTDAVEGQTHRALGKLQKHLANSEATLPGIDIEKREEQNLLNRLHINLYRVFGALSMSIDAVMEFHSVDNAVGQPQQKKLEKAFFHLEAVLNTMKRGMKETDSWQAELVIYEGIVKELQSDWAAGMETENRSSFFFMRILMALDQVGKSLREMRRDLILFEDQVFS
jgi:hypothetical protein